MYVYFAFFLAGNGKPGANLPYLQIKIHQHALQQNSKATIYLLMFLFVFLFVARMVYSNHIYSQRKFNYRNQKKIKI